MAPVATEESIFHHSVVLPQVDPAKLAAAQGNIGAADGGETKAAVESLSLKSNSGFLPPSKIGWLTPTDPRTTSMDEMRRRFMTDGYVLVKGLIPREDSLKARKDYFEFMRDTGVLKEGTDPQDGIYCGDDVKNFLPPGNGETCQIAADDHPSVKFLNRSIEAHKADFYLNFVSHPALKEFVQKFCGWPEVLLLQRQMLRANVPGAPTTAVHYDQLFLRGAGPTFLTGWVPMGDVAADGGGLIYLEKSHHLGKKIEDDFNERAKDFSEEEKRSAFNAHMMAGGMLSDDPNRFMEDNGGHRWLVANYEAGDVVFHHPYMVHASTLNESKTGSIRLATDLRFVNPQEPYDDRWMVFWTPQDGL